MTDDLSITLLSKRGEMAGAADLFAAALDAREREIARLRAALDEATKPPAFHLNPATVVVLPRFHRPRLVVNHVEVAGTGRTRFDCTAITADGEAIVLASISEVHLRRVVKAHERAGFVIEHRGRRVASPDQNAGGAIA